METTFKYTVGNLKDTVLANLSIEDKVGLKG